MLKKPSFASRAASVVRSRFLDQAIAAGACPESGESLAVRAEWLVRPDVRRQLAVRLSDLFDQAMGWTRRTHPAGVPVAEAAIYACGDLLGELIERLTIPAPVSPRGVAMVSDLLTDGGGPLYPPVRSQTLRARLRYAAVALDPIADFGEGAN